MDQRQKDIVNSLSHELADTLRANDLGEMLIISKLISKHDVDSIMSKIESNFCRNLKLFDCVQESDHPSTFDDFMGILVRLEPDAVMKFTSPNDRPEKYRKSTTTRTIFDKMFDIFGKSSSKNYPLGMTSGLSSGGSSASTHTPNTPITNHSTSGLSNTSSQYGDTSSLSPLKEKHQTTLISSSSAAVVSPNNTDGYTLAPRYPGQLPITPRPSANPSSNNTSDRTNRQLANKISQTPNRHHEMSLINNLSITEGEEGEEGGGEEEEPVVSWHPYAQSPGQESVLRAASPHRCLPSYSSASSESGDSSSDSLFVDPNLIMDSNVMAEIAREGPNMMSVKMAAVCHNNQEEDYKMTSRPRGLCLIVNNIIFESEMFPTRRGSDEDANRFDQIFGQLGFQTIMARNLTADGMKRKFKELSASCKQEHDALFVFILSHGSEDGIYGVDGIEVYLESEIISCFDNRNCKAMIGKPKVFVIQACRGRSKDCGGGAETLDSIAWAPVHENSQVASVSQENRVPASWLPSYQSDGKKRKHPIRTDMLLIFSCLAGFVSVRNETAGSWLGVALAYFIMKYAHERDFLRILNLVTSDIIQRESSSGHIQSIETKLLGWTKNLYFNPGIYL